MIEFDIKISFKTLTDFKFMFCGQSWSSKIGHVANQLSDSVVKLAHSFEKEFQKVFII